MLFHIRSSIEEYKKLKQTVITQAVTKGVRGKREMKDSGVEWIGEIPKEWSTPKIKRLHNGLTDGTHGTFNRIDSGHILLSSKMCVNLEFNSVKMKALSLRLIIILSQQMDFHRKMMCSCVVSVHPSEDVRFMNLRKQWLFKGVLFSLDAIV